MLQLFGDSEKTKNIEGTVQLIRQLLDEEDR